MRRGKRRGNILDRAADAFDLPAEVVAGMPKITVTGCSKVYIESHKGILEYSEELISVNGGRVILKIRGGGLEICSMNAGELLIEGLISGVEIEQ